MLIRRQPLPLSNGGKGDAGAGVGAQTSCGGDYLKLSRFHNRAPLILEFAPRISAVMCPCGMTQPWVGRPLDGFDDGLYFYGNAHRQRYDSHC